LAVLPSQGKVPSPLLWNSVVDNLIRRFQRKAPKITAYTDDIGIIITGVCPSTLSSIMESTLREVCDRAEKVGLNNNADKTDLIFFTKR